MPEYAVAIDYYDGKFLIQEYAAPKTISPEKAKERFMETLFAVESVFDCSEKAIFIKQRMQQKNKQQYQRLDDAKQFFEVQEYLAKFWVNLSRNSFESAGVGQMTFIDGTNKYKNLIGVVCPYGVLWIDNEGRSRGQGSILKVKCSKDKGINKRLR